MKNLKEQATRINSMQLDKSMQDDNRAITDDIKSILVNFLTTYLIEPYEAYCKDEEITLYGINETYNWLEKFGFIFVSPEEKENIWGIVQDTIEKRKQFTHNKGKVFHPVMMCREISIMNMFKIMRTSKVDLRSEILKTIENENR
jgi:hypothetical protein